jgi:hypothetical protein
MKKINTLIPTSSFKIQNFNQTAILPPNVKSTEIKSFHSRRFGSMDLIKAIDTENTE